MDRITSVLVLEDEGFIAFDLITQLDREGFAPVGPFERCAPAIARIESDPLDAAIMDSRLPQDETSEAAADALAARGTPFVGLSGFAATDRLASSRYADRPRLSKPCEPSDLLAAMSGIPDRDPEGRE